MAGVQLIIRPDQRSMREVREKIAALERVAKSPRRSFGRTAQFILREARRIIRAGAHTWGPISGKLGKSLTMLLDEASVFVGSNLVYAAIQHEGGTVRPKGHPYLAIPAQASLRRGAIWPRDLPRDRMRFIPAARIRIGSHSWTGPALVRVQQETYSYRVSSGPHKGEVRTKQRGRIGEVMFALIKRATIPGMHYLILPWEQGGRKFLIEELQRQFAEAGR